MSAAPERLGSDGAATVLTMTPGAGRREELAAGRGIRLEGLPPGIRGRGLVPDGDSGGQERQVRHDVPHVVAVDGDRLAVQGTLETSVDPVFERFHPAGTRAVLGVSPCDADPGL